MASSLISLGLKDMPTYNGVTYRGTHLSYKKLEELYLNNLGGIIQEKAFEVMFDKGSKFKKKH